MSGIARAIDSTGRIVIPREALRALKWVPGDPILVEIDNHEGHNIIRLSKSQAICHLCSGPLVQGHFITLYEKPVCDRCVAQLYTMKGVQS